jgi:two-component system response regulator DesR
MSDHAKWQECEVPDPIRITVVAEPVLFRSALTLALNCEYDFHVVAPSAAPDLALVDLHRSIRCPPPALPVHLPECPIVLLTNEQPHRYIHVSRIRGVLARERGVGQLADALRRVAAGERVIEPVSTDRLVRGLSSLTDREREVLRLAASGLPAADIASDLQLTVGTVRNYVSMIVRKTGSRNRLEAIRAADEAGWL